MPISLQRMRNPKLCMWVNAMAEGYLRMSFFGFIVLIVLLNSGILSVLLAPFFRAVEFLLPS